MPSLKINYIANAFWMGLAAPVSLWAQTPTYPTYNASTGLGESFAEVGRNLSAAANTYRVGQTGSEQQQTERRKRVTAP